MSTLHEMNNKEGVAVAAPSSRSRFLGLRIFLVFCACVFTALGAWQVQRLFWKLDLIARVDARVHAPAVAPPEGKAGENAAALEYLHVTTTGTFDHSKETLVQAVTELGPGFWVLTPLKLADGSTILINRGFVPSDKRDPAARAQGEIAGTVSITGLLRQTEPKGGFLRSNAPADNRWYSRDVEAIAQAKGIADVAPYFIDADATANPGGYPVGGLTVIQFRNSHLSYALTWFVLAAMAIGAIVIVARRSKSGDRDGD